MLARDIMKKKVLSISPDHSVRHAARTMLENQISGLPVCDDRGRLVGMLSEGDLLRRAELRSVSWRDIAGVRTKSEAFIKGHSCASAT